MNIESLLRVMVRVRVFTILCIKLGHELQEYGNAADLDNEGMAVICSGLHI